MIKSFILPVLIILIPLSGKSALSGDSLLQAIESAGEDTNKVVLLVTLAKEMAAKRPADALNYFNVALKLSEKLNYQRGITTVYNDMGLIYINQGKIEDAIQQYRKLLTIDSISGNKREMARTMNNIALIYCNQNKIPTAIEYMKKSLEIQEAVNDISEIANFSYNLGALYYKDNNPDSALRYYQRAMVLCEKTGNTKGLAYTLNSMGIIYSEQGEPEKALEYYDKAVELSEKSGDLSNLAATLHNIGEFHKDKKDYKKALSYCMRAYRIFMELGYPNEIKNAAYTIKSIYLLMNDYSNAIKYFEVYSEIKDSLLNEKNSRIITEMQTKYETQKKESEIRTLVEDKAVREKQTKRQIVLRNILIIALAVLLSVTAIVLLRFRQRKVIHKKLAEQKQKYVTSSMSQAQKELLVKEITRSMEEKRLFIDSNLTLDTLAIQLNTNKHYLSQVINEIIGKNFYTITNEYRIREAKKLLCSPEYRNVTIEGIANLVGFKSKSSFNTAFKKITGMTPSEYLREKKE